MNQRNKYLKEPFAVHNLNNKRPGNGEHED